MTQDIEPKIVWLDRLGRALQLAKRAAEAVSQSDDGGSCNLDAPMLFIGPRRLTERDLQQLAEDAPGTSLNRSQWFGRVCYIVNVGSFGQGNNNTRTAEAVCSVLKDQGFDCTMYYKVD